jgi:hypothetical protein
MYGYGVALDEDGAVRMVGRSAHQADDLCGYALGLGIVRTGSAL